MLWYESYTFVALPQFVQMWSAKSLCNVIALSGQDLLQKKKKHFSFCVYLHLLFLRKKVFE